MQLNHLNILDKQEIQLPLVRAVLVLQDFAIYMILYHHTSQIIYFYFLFYFILIKLIEFFCSSALNQIFIKEKQKKRVVCGKMMNIIFPYQISGAMLGPQKNYAEYFI